jgi:hypothetical protein
MFDLYRDWRTKLTTANAIFLTALIFMAVGLMVAGYVFKRPALPLGSAGAWLITGLVSYGLSAGGWDVYYGFFWFCIVLVIVAAFEAFYAREKQSPPEEPKEDWDTYIEDLEQRRNRLDRLHNLRRTGNTERPSRYSRTGRP